MNTQVTAKGMEVTAKAPTSLLISKANATTGFGSTVVLENDISGAAAMFAPVAYADVAASWYKLTSDAMANVDQDGRVAGFTELADGSPAASFTGASAVYEDGGINVYHDIIWLKVEGENDQTVTATAAYVSDPAVTDKIKDAMHIVFVVNNVVVDTINMGGSDEKLTTDTLTTLIANATNSIQVDIYYFLSGNDPDCKNTNISADATMSIDITFTAANA